jgi:ribosomal protein S18 acetylase RimI-like enzyme
MDHHVEMPEQAVTIRRLGPGDGAEVVAAASLFDRAPRPDWTSLFLTRDGHHLLIAYVAGAPAGFVTGIEMTHPDKGTEMMVYELGVDARFRRRGIGRALVESLRDLARQRQCRAMWVPIEPDDGPAIATYRAAGAGPPEPAALLSWQFATVSGSAGLHAEGPPRA